MKITNNVIFYIILPIFLALFLIPSFIYPSYDLKEPVWVYYGRGNRYFHDGKLGFALAEYKKALSIINEELKKTGERNEYFPDIALKIAEIYFKEGLYEEALFYLDLSEKNSELFQIKDKIFLVYYLRADCYIKLNRVDKAIKTYMGIISRDERWEIYKNLKAEQIPDFIDSPEDRAKFGKAYLNLGKIKFYSNNYENAIMFLKMSFIYKYNINLSFELLKKCYDTLGYNFMDKILNERLNMAVNTEG